MTLCKVKRCVAISACFVCLRWQKVTLPNRHPGRPSTATVVLCRHPQCNGCLTHRLAHPAVLVSGGCVLVCLQLGLNLGQAAAEVPQLLGLVRSQLQALVLQELLNTTLHLWNKCGTNATQGCWLLGAHISSSNFVGKMQHATNVMMLLLMFSNAMLYAMMLPKVIIGLCAPAPGP